MKTSPYQAPIPSPRKGLSDTTEVLRRARRKIEALAAEVRSLRRSLALRDRHSKD